MKLEVDLKTLITLGGIVAMLSGFIYTTKLRLDNVETQMVELEEEQSRLKRRLRPHTKKKEKKNVR